MRKIIAPLLLLISASGWAAYQPVNGSTIVVNSVQISSAVPSVSTVQLAPGTLSKASADEFGRLSVVGPRYSFASSSSTAITVSTACAKGVGTSSVTIVSPGSGNHLRVYYLEATNTGATTTTVGWRDTTSGTPYGAILYENSEAQNVTFAHNLKPGYWDLPSNTGLCIYTSAAGNILWTVEYETLPD